jgi:FkbM family methyltransferase
VASPVKYRLPSGMEIFQLNDYQTPYLYDEIFGQREYVLDRIAMPVGGVVVDVGANIGMFSLFAMMEWHPSRLIAVESVPELQEILRLNLNSWPAARVAPVAAGRERGTTSFTFYPQCSMLSGRFCNTERDLATAKAQDADWPKIGNIAMETEEHQASVGSIVRFLESHQLKCEVRQRDMYRKLGSYMVFAQGGPDSRQSHGPRSAVLP